MTANSQSTAHKSYLALGDSYTIGESVIKSDRFPEQLAKRLTASGIPTDQTDIVAVTGWTTGDLLEGIRRSKNLQKEYDVVTLLIGVNNQYQGKPVSEYAAEFEVLLQKSIELAGDHRSRVFVLSIPDYSVTPFAAAGDQAKIAHEIDLFNGVNRKIASRYQVKWIDITGESRKARADRSLVAEDGLHFTGKEYAQWVDLLFPLVNAALQ